MVSRSTILSDSFSIIHSVLNDNVTEIVNNAGDTITLREANGNYWYGSFPDIDIKQKDEYPIGVIGSPLSEHDTVGIRWTEEGVSTEISVHTTRAEHAPKFIEKAMEALRTERARLHNNGLYNLSFGSMNRDMEVRGDLKVHTMLTSVSFKYGHETGIESGGL